MLRIKRIPCKWCNRSISAIWRGYAWVAECEHCHDNYEAKENNDVGMVTQKVQ